MNSNNCDSNTLNNNTGNNTSSDTNNNVQGASSKQDNNEKQSEAKTKSTVSIIVTNEIRNDTSDNELNDTRNIDNNLGDDDNVVLRTSCDHLPFILKRETTPSNISTSNISTNVSTTIEHDDPIFAISIDRYGFPTEQEESEADEAARRKRQRKENDRLVKWQQLCIIHFYVLLF